ncbi:MAG: CocE/NonD family hydrolase, partial [Neisseria sp.]|nr:CocE/NonD family hydrolase [Neisseria sp.]
MAIAYHLLENVMVAMRDGVRLATDVYLPAHCAAPFPVVIERTPYNKSAHSRSEICLDGHKVSRSEMAAAFAQRGFATVFQDCRGRYRSEGEFIKYVREGEDGFDTYQWLLQQPWCNGNIGSMGLSYAAHTQLAAACLNPQGLRAMVLDSGGFHNAHQCGIRQGGAFELKQATWAYKQAKLSPEAAANPALKAALEQENIHEWFGKMPWTKGNSPIRHLPEYEDYLLTQWQAGEFDSYWQQLGIYAQGWYEQLPDIPVLLMSSWYDAYVPATLSNFQAFAADGRRAPQRLIMGSWLHGDRNISHSGNVEFGEHSPFDGNIAENWLECRLQWFEQHLKKPANNTPTHAENTHATEQTPHQVSLFVMGGGDGSKNADGRLQHGGQWLHSNTYPLPNSRVQTLYLQADGGLREQVAADGTHTLVADPNRPVPTIGGAITSGAPVFVGGAFDQRETPEFYGADGSGKPLNARDDVLSFQTDVLTEDLIVAGEVRIQLWIASDAPDCDFTAKLIDVYPPSADYPEGYAMNITDGIIRTRYRNSWAKSELLAAGEIVEVCIRPFETANLFQKGHRLRLDIAGSNFPHFDCNPNSGEAEGFAEHKRIATSQIHVG